MRCLWLIVLATVMIMPTLTMAAPRVVGQKILGVYTGDDQGAYDQVYAAIQKATGADLPKIEVMSAGEAIDLYTKGQAECMTPGNTNRDFYPVTFQAIQSKPFNVAKVYIFTAPGTEPLSSLDALKGKRIAVRDGFAYGATFDAAGLNPEKNTTIEANIAKLLKGRLDAIVDFVPDAWDAFLNYGMPPLPYRADKPVAVHQDAVVCRETPETRALITTIDQGIKILSSGSALKELLGTSYSPE